MCSILPTVQAIIPIYLEYLCTAFLTQLAGYQVDAFTISPILVRSSHTFSLLFNLHALVIGEGMRVRPAWPRMPLPEKKSPRNPTYVVKYFSIRISKFHFTLCNEEI
jgi:hypothetical protein